MAEFDKNEQREEIFSKAVRAGKRTYFFDVKATRSSEYYLTITESKKKFTEDGEKPFYEKHKIFLYREDFDKFMEGLNEAVGHIRGAQGDKPERSSTPPPEGNSFTDVNYEDLGDK